MVTREKRSGSFRRFINGLAQDLSAEDCKGLSYLADLSNSAITHCCCRMHGRVGALGLLEKMEVKGLYSPSDMSPLASLLREVGRSDLAGQCEQRSSPSPPPPLRLEHRRSSTQETDHIRITTPNVENKATATMDTATIDTPYSSIQTRGINSSSNGTSKDHTLHRETTPSSSLKRFSLPLRCDMLSLSTSRLSASRLFKRKSSSRHRSPMPTAQSLDTSDEFILVDRSELQGFIGADHTSSPCISSDEFSPSPDELSPDELSYNTSAVGHGQRQRSTTDPCARDLPILSPTHSFDDSTYFSPTHLSPQLSLGSSTKLSWSLRRTDFLEPIFKHTAKCFEKCFKMRVGRGSGRCGLTVALKLYPNGVNWASDKSVSLQVEVTTPTSHISSTLYFGVKVVEKAQLLVSMKKVCKLSEKRAFLIEEFIAHDVIKNSQAKCIQIFLDLQLGYRLGEDWVCVGNGHNLGCLQ